MKSRIGVLLAAFILSVSCVLAQERPHAFVGATVYPISGPPIQDGLVLVQDGKIVAVGTQSTVRLSSSVVRIDVSGKVIMPGLVDTHSHVGEVSGGDASSPMQPEVRVLDAINVLNPSVHRARAGGVTTANIMSGSGHLLSGQTAYLKLRKGKTIYDLLYCENILTEICGGIKMANGTNSIRTPGGSFPGTRARSAAIARQMFTNAVQYRDKKTAAVTDSTKAPGVDLQMEALIEVMDGRRIVHFHTHRHDDVLTALRLGQEFGFTPVLHHVSEGWKVADEIAAAGAKASIIMIDSPGGKLEAVDVSYITGRVMEEAGVDVAYHTDDLITDSRYFLRSAALGVRAGMSRAKALEALTLAGARMLNLDSRVGSLEAGKDADFIILSGDPFSVYTRIEQTWIEGQKVFDLSNPEDKNVAVGAYGVLRGENLHLHEMGIEE